MHYCSPCKDCGFELWHPLWSNPIVQVGLYDDARFPGRMIVMLNEHYDHFDEVPESLTANFMWELQCISRVARSVLAAERINMSILGNAVSHVHAHLIPRRATDPLPYSAPWSDPRPRATLEIEALEQLTLKLSTALHPHP